MAVLPEAMTNLRYAITTRRGGVSRGPYASLNLGFHVGDEAACVRVNRKIVAKRFGFDARRLVCAQQVHGAASHLVTAQDVGRGALNWESAIPDCDALIVAEPNVPVMILVADCAPILIVAPDVHVFALVHAGWRGAVAGVIRSTLGTISSELNADVRQTRVLVGPCLCAGCLEVGEEVAEQVPRKFIASVEKTGDARPHLNLSRLLTMDARYAGVRAENIEATNDCPRCNNETYFSHRAGNGVAGRFGMVAWWE